MTTGNEGQRYSALDAFRFVAASGVVFYHFENHFQPFLPAPTHHLERFQLLVDFFFVLSGFVMAHSYGARITTAATYLTFLRRRLARVYPLHLIVTAAFCVAGLVVVLRGIPVRDRSFFDPALLPANLLIVQAWGVTDRAGLNIPSWSISAEWFAYLLFPAFALLLRRCGAIATLLIAAGVAILVDVWRSAVGLGPGDTATFDFGNLRAVPSFLAGMAVYALVAHVPPRRVPWALPYSVAALLLVLMLLHAPPALLLIGSPLLVALVAVTEHGGARSILQSRAAVALGHASFAIYMIHTLFQVAAVVAARQLGWTSVPQLLAVATVTYGAIVLASLASFRWIENPLRRLLSGNGRPHATLAARPL